MTEKQQNERFFNGSWSAYRLKDLADADNISVSRIKRSENAFRDKYFATVEFFWPSPIFLSWSLTLKQKPITRKSPRSKKGKTVDKISEKAAIFKFALYHETGSKDSALLFCNRRIPNYVTEILNDGLSCSAMEPVNLFGSSPIELLKLHLDARSKSPKLEGLCVAPFNELTDMRLYTEPMEKESSAFIRKIGRIEAENLPKIRSVNVEFNEAPIEYYSKSKIAKLKNWSFSSVEMDIKSSSVFHLYGALSEYLYKDDVPEWLSDGIRRKGRTGVKVHYE